MQDRTSSTEHSIAERKLPSAWVSEVLSVVLARLRAPCSCSIGLIFLIFTIALYGYGYKIAQFEFQTHQTAHIPVAKALNEHRQDSLPVKVHGIRHRDRLQFEMAPDGEASQVQISSRVLGTYAQRLQVLPRALPFFDSALPLRSPPVLTA